MKFFINNIENLENLENMLGHLTSSELKNIVIQKGIFSSFYTTATTELFDNFSTFDNIYKYQKNIPLELLNTFTMAISAITIYLYIKYDSKLNKTFENFNEYYETKRITNFFLLMLILLFVKNVDKVY